METPTDMDPPAFETYRARNRDEKRAARRAALIAELRRRHRLRLMRRMLAFGLPTGLAGLLLAAVLLGLMPWSSDADDLAAVPGDTVVAAHRDRAGPAQSLAN
ncbi:hypothetical protein L2U69_18560 [Zavarzinia compransoris]|uniref:hypothetical protein n=1 Tax=Zavarzinia marina TaxID=2911065 RepID=UPI001F170B3B|nr:hypothetical protein [Zavarzinia marina]MCF4167654.1 hypothetical protein [Zavarzinia marina]